MKPEELEDLHTHMRHQSRLYLDLQKTRISITNRIGAIERLAVKEGTIETPLVVFATGELTLAAGRLEDAEKKSSSELVKLARKHPMRSWIDSTHGIGLHSLSVLIGLTGSLSDFSTVSKLWRYCGMDVQDGHAPRRQQGVLLRYSPNARVLCHQIGVAIVKTGGPYRAIYDDRKAKVKLRVPDGPSQCLFGQTHRDKKGNVIQCGDAHANNDAMRVASKALLRDMWIEWHITL